MQLLVLSIYHNINRSKLSAFRFIAAEKNLTFAGGKRQTNRLNAILSSVAGRFPPAAEVRRFFADFDVVAVLNCAITVNEAAVVCRTTASIEHLASTSLDDPANSDQSTMSAVESQEDRRRAG